MLFLQNQKCSVAFIMPLSENYFVLNAKHVCQVVYYKTSIKLFWYALPLLEVNLCRLKKKQKRLEYVFKPSLQFNNYIFLFYRKLFL